MSGVLPSSGFNYDQIGKSMGDNTKTQADALKAAMDYASSASGKNDPNAMFKVQEAMSKWSMANSLQSTMIQQLGEAMKGVIQKM